MFQGGKVLLYPKLEEMFSFISGKGHIINTAINAKDISTVLKDKKLMNVFRKYISGIGVSICNDDDVEIASHIREIKRNDYHPYIVFHLIPEYLGADKTVKYMNDLIGKYGYYNFLFLGYKINGRGQNYKFHNLSNDDLQKLMGDTYNIGIDTTFANRYYDWLKNNFETEHTITLNEGEYSMYIDGVEQKAYKSSYQLDKPYNFAIGNYEDQGKTWYNPQQAFDNIRKDNGFKVYDYYTM